MSTVLCLFLGEPGFKGFDDGGDVDYNFDNNLDDLEPVFGKNSENLETYEKNVLDMQKHEQNQMEIVLKTELTFSCFDILWNIFVFVDG